MDQPFAGKLSAYGYFEVAVQRVREDLLRMDEAIIVATDEQSLVTECMDRWGIKPLEIDPSRRPTYRLEKEVKLNQIRGSDIPVPTEYREVIIELPLIPHRLNSYALNLISTNRRLDSMPRRHHIPSVLERISFRQEDQQLILRAFQGDEERMIQLVRELMDEINKDVASQFSSFQEEVERQVKEYKRNVARDTAELEQKMQTLGIELKKNAEAVEPVNLRIRETIQILRDATEPYLKEDAASKIVDLIDQVGKNFEVAPLTYSKLGEEDLRNIIIAQLNTVFASTIATGETFSNRGKADIIINSGNGAVFVCECKLWYGVENYEEAMKQIFRYITWRHTIGALIIFSRNKGLTRAMNEAIEHIRNHGSYRGNFSTKNSTYHTAIHVHPEDENKTIEMHYLFFNLFSEQAPRRARKKTENVKSISLIIEDV